MRKRREFTESETTRCDKERERSAKKTRVRRRERTSVLRCYVVRERRERRGQESEKEAEAAQGYSYTRVELEDGGSAKGIEVHARESTDSRDRLPAREGLVVVRDACLRGADWRGVVERELEREDWRAGEYLWCVTRAYVKQLVRGGT